MANKDCPKAAGEHIKITAVYMKTHGKKVSKTVEFKRYWEENIGGWNPTE